MRIFGFEITRAAKRKQFPLSSVDSRGAWWPLVYESSPGAWQRNVEINIDAAYAYYVVWACSTLIAGDIGKLDLRLMARGDVWTATENTAYSPVLRKPNQFQTRQKFIETWLFCKLLRGNFYGLKRRDSRGVVIAIYPLHPDRVTPLVSTSGEVFYQLQKDDIARVSKDIPAAPASEIIHDPMYCLFHPLVGVSPLYAAALHATTGLRIHENGATFFEGRAMPSGILTAPGRIGDDTAKRLKDHWESNYSGEKFAKGVAVLGDGLDFKAMTMNAVDAQIVQQAELSDKAIASAFHVPAYKVGVGPMPTHDNIEALDQQYYSQCLQVLIESLEAHLDEGLGLGSGYRTEFDLGDLMRMDSARKVDAAGKLVGAGILAPNEARAQFGLGPVTGGASPMLQQQNYSLAALARRDAEGPPPGTQPAPQLAANDDESGGDEMADGETQARRMGAGFFTKGHAVLDSADAA